MVSTPDKQNVHGLLHWCLTHYQNHSKFRAYVNSRCYTNWATTCCNFYHPPTKFREGNVFIGVCNSVHGEVVSGYAWYQVPLGGWGWVYKREGYKGWVYWGHTMGWELRVGIPRRRVKQRGWMGMTWYTHSPPWCWHLVMASEAGGTHPTGMLSFFSAESWGGSTTSPERTGTSSSTAKHATSAGHRSWSTPVVCHLFLVSIDIKFASCSPAELDMVPISGF